MGKSFFSFFHFTISNIEQHVGGGVAVIDETTLEGAALEGAAVQDGSLLEGDQY